MLYELYLGEVFGDKYFLTILPYFTSWHPSKPTAVWYKLKARTAFYEIFTAWLYFSLSSFSRKHDSPAHILETGCKIKSINKDKGRSWKCFFRGAVWINSRTALHSVIYWSLGLCSCQWLEIMPAPAFRWYLPSQEIFSVPLSSFDTTYNSRTCHICYLWF